MTFDQYQATLKEDDMPEETELDLIYKALAAAQAEVKRLVGELEKALKKAAP